MVRGRWEEAGKSEEQNLLSEKSSSPRHRRRPLHTLCSSLFLPRPRPTTSRDPFRPRHQPPGGPRHEACRSRRCEFDTRSCMPCGLAENGSQYVHNKIYTEMSTLARTHIYVLLSSVSRERISAGSAGSACVYVRTYRYMSVGYSCFQRRNPRYRRGFHVPDTRPPCSRSLNTISSFNRCTAAQTLFLSFSFRAHNTCIFFAPRIRGMLLGDVAIRGWFYPRQMDFADRRVSRESNHVPFEAANRKPSNLLGLVRVRECPESGSV